MSYPKSRTPQTDRDEYRTPPEIFRWAADEWGGFDFDLAATEENSMTPRFFDRECNALAFPWARHMSHAWCNPPYSNIAPWFKKAGEEARYGLSTVFLVPTPNGEARDRLIWDMAEEMVFIVGRIPFLRPDGIPAPGNPRGSCFVRFTPNAAEDPEWKLKTRYVNRQSFQHYVGGLPC